jgi:gamma-glutamylcyclotransferase (GGCT)/AIG2-like uncharacterized protein YtfP
MNDDINLPLFVYGTLLSDQPAFDLIAGAVERSALARAPGLVLASVGPYPLAAPGVGEVVGEVHWLRATQAPLLLDRLTQYEGPEYTPTRHQVFVLPHQTPLLAWLFLGDPAQAARLPAVPNGDWRAWRKRHQTHTR